MATEAPASYIDTLLKRVAAHGATLGIRFESGAPVRVTDGNGGGRDVTSRTLSSQEILAAITPTMPEPIRRLPQPPSVAFNYNCTGVGLFSVALQRDGDKITVSFDRGDASAAGLAKAAPARSEAAPQPQKADTAEPTQPAPQARPTEPELIVETTSVSAVVAANAPASPSVPQPEVALHGAHAIDRLFQLMCEAKASDLHLSVGMPPLVRKDGEIKVLDAGAPAFDPDSVWAMLHPIMPERNREEFECRHDTDFAYEIADLGRFRSNVFMDRKGPGAVFRVIPSKILTAEELGLSPHILKLCQLNKGLVLVTGPTGSGKSTTLCAMIDYINRTRRDHIITIEDPIEFVHENKQCLMNQREVHTHTDGFKDALRAALREDPDIVLVGEMRDLETVAIAIETAETGHLVFGTLHTTTAASTVDRVIDQFPSDRQAQIRIMLSESLKGVIAQTLCKKIGGGRAAALEVLIVTSAVSNLIREAKTFQIPSIMQVGKSVGMVSLNDALMDLVAKKLVAPEEAYLKCVDKTGFESLLKRAGIDTKFAAVSKEN